MDSFDILKDDYCDKDQFSPRHMLQQKLKDQEFNIIENCILKRNEGDPHILEEEILLQALNNLKEQDQIILCDLDNLTAIN